MIEEDLNKKLDSFRTLFSETFEKEFDNEKLKLIIQDLDKISQNVRKYDDIIYNVSQKITTKEKKVVKKHKKIIDNWIKVKDSFNTKFNYYIDGFQLFHLLKDDWHA